jgi:hypothetical protein
MIFILLHEQCEDLVNELTVLLVELYNMHRGRLERGAIGPHLAGSFAVTFRFSVPMCLSEKMNTRRAYEEQPCCYHQDRIDPW